MFDRRTILALLAASISTSGRPGLASTQTAVKVALNEAPSIENLPLLIALHRASLKGVDIQAEVLPDDGDVTVALSSGTADLGVGVPYRAIRDQGAPLKVLSQLTRVTFFPVIDTSMGSLQDMGRQPVVVHGPTSASNLLADEIERRYGFKFGERIYMPGSRNRANALVEGKAPIAIIDYANMVRLVEEHDGRYASTTLKDVNASDEVIFASSQALKDKQAAISVIIAELVSTIRDLDFGYELIKNDLERQTLIDQVSEELSGNLAEKVYEANVIELYPDLKIDPAEIAQTDIKWYLEDNITSPDTYWDFGPLRAAL